MATGIARGALDAFLTTANRTPALATSPLRDEARIQLQIADAEASLRSARAFLYDALQDVWNATERGRPVPIKARAILRLACVPLGFNNGYALAMRAGEAEQARNRQALATSQRIPT